MVNPITQKRQFLYAYCLFWILIAFFQCLGEHYLLEKTWEISIVEALSFISIYALLGLSIWFVVRFSGLETGNLFNAIITHTAAASILVGAWLSVTYALLSLIFSKESLFPDSFTSELWWRIAFGYIFYIMIALNYYLLIFYQNFREKQVRESEMNMMLKESELSMLKAQINPHFIFNSLNSISSLTLTRPEDAHEMIVKLSSFLRHTIGHSETELVSIQKEIDTIQLYLDIEKSRFGEKLVVKIQGMDDIDPKTLIPYLILQPIVENAIKYGVYESTSTCKIEIKLKAVKEFTFIEIYNDLESDGVSKKGKGIGIKNVKDRLRLIYERDDLFETHINETHFIAKITIPQTTPNE